MEHHLHQQVDIGKLKTFLKQAKFPATEDELEKQAKTAKADKNVVDFLESLDEKLTFQNTAAVVAKAEEVNLLRQEETDSPPERVWIDEY